MAPSVAHLPNGQRLSVTPVFGGIQFKADEVSGPHSLVPPGWTIVILQKSEDSRQTQRFRTPSLRNDHVYISSISNPTANEFRPSGSTTRQIAMMLWATLWWYFHQPEPDKHLTTAASSNTPLEGRPQGDWIINIDAEGIFKGRNLLAKFERMGLISTEESSVGSGPEDGWGKMMVSQRAFWQMDPRIYLFQLNLGYSGTPYPLASPTSSRPSSPERRQNDVGAALQAASARAAQVGRTGTPPGPFGSSSHLPTYYPPHPLRFTMTNGVRHPIRAKPPRQGEIFYTRFVPSLGQYLSFRVASLSNVPVRPGGPTSTWIPDAGIGSPMTRESQHATMNMTDVELLHKWMNDERVAHSWGEGGPSSHQERFLKQGLESRHSFPAIGCFDGRPFGYFEIYWVKEDRLGRHLSECGNWDRGLHVLVGENEFRGPHRVAVWLSALVHYCWMADMRTETVVMEPRVDNEKLRRYTEALGFYKEREVTLEHKQSNLMKLRREAWTAPAL
ncbi:hypothetical protein K470DRAFT_217834 [Piedraia hortae CBS 480.64]|uniref:Acyltransferase MbtK/IucB-like conserved domain-containing protein n=1 Tax=Piedraia hortae CBS 480.64 TaxID=1314780 RepID=A0A6A7BZH3_9PEZI|nr:hypothetical protein K470DRAFT_217834 [Piedraia hortae CBS 480.64]